MVPTSTNMLKTSSAMYDQTIGTTASDVFMVGGADANSENMMQARIMIDPSRHTPVYDLRKLIPTCCVGAPAKVANGTGAIAV